MEPERKIEKLLRAFAKKRRDDAGDSFKLHPATRRLLQSEVARRAPKRKEDNLLWQLFSGANPAGRILGMSVVVVIFFVFTTILLPSISKSKSKAQAIASMNNLKQIGVASKEFAEVNNQRLPQSLAEIQPIAGTNSVIDPVSGKPFVYVAGGRSVDSLQPDSVLAYSPEDDKSRAVLYADGRVETVSRSRFSEITNRGLIQLADARVPASREIAEYPASSGAATTTRSGAGGEVKVADAPTERVALSAADSEKNKAEAERSDRFKSADVSAVTGASALPSKAEMIAGSKLDGVGAVSGEITTQNSFVSNAATVTQKFAQQAASKSNAQNLFRNATASATVTPVLANFQFQQNGSTVAVVDEDGSVYNGYLVAAIEAKMQIETAQSKSAPKSPAAPMQKQAKDAPEEKMLEPAAQNYFFRVAGTNRSLRQNVVFTGNMLTFSNGAQVSSQTFNRARGVGGNVSQVMDKNFSQQNLFSNSRIEGTAVVNNTDEIQIEALPVAQ